MPSSEVYKIFTASTGKTSNTPALAHIHDRSPVIVDQADRDAWLTVPFDALAQFERPYPAEQFRVEATDTLWIQRRSRIELTDWFDALSGRAKIRTAQNRQM